MQRLSKIILIVFAAVLALVAIGIGGALFYVQGEGGRERLAEAVSDALKVPVKIGKVAVSLPSTVRVEGIETVESGAAGQPKLRAGALHGTIALGPLFSGNIEIHNVELDSPVFEWPQNADGRWAWPSEEKKKELKPVTDEPKSKKAPGRKTSVLVSGIKMNNGTVEMRNAEGRPLLSASGVTTDVSEASERQIAGSVAIARLVWAERFPFENVRMNVRYAGEVLVLDDLDAAIFGGSMRGRYEMDTKADGQPFKARLDLRAVDLNPLATAAGWEDGDLAGRLSGEADVSGHTDRIERLEGPGRLSIVDGHFTKLGLFGTIAELVGLTELANLRTREASAVFNLRDEKTFIDSIVLATENIRLSANGVARFDKKLTLDAQLSVPERFVQTLPEIARGSFTKRDDGRHALDFKITGKTDKPKTDLAERLIGGKVQDKLGDLLGNLFGTKPEKKDEPKPDGEKK